MWNGKAVLGMHETHMLQRLFALVIERRLHEHCPARPIDNVDSMMSYGFTHEIADSIWLRRNVSTMNDGCRTAGRSRSNTDGRGG